MTPVPLLSLLAQSVPDTVLVAPVATSGWPRNQVATFRPLSPWRAIRTGRVRRPRSIA